MKVSVLVPVYGVEKYIERCAVSLFEQTHRDMEYVFVKRLYSRPQHKHLALSYRALS